MTLYIAKNGQRTGPYTLAEVQGFLANGTFNAADFAWYEGLTDWIPLQQVPGIVSTSAQRVVPTFGAAAASPAQQGPVRRPVLVWIICLFYFIFIPIGLISMAVMPYLFSFSAKMEQKADAQIQSQLDGTTDPAQKEQLASALSQLKKSQALMAKVANRGFLYYGLAAFSMILSLIAAILLFILRRSAFPAFIVAYMVSLVGTIYNYATTDFSQLGGAAPAVSIVIGIVTAIIGWGIAIAILFYVWSLARRNVLH